MMGRKFCLLHELDPQNQREPRSKSRGDSLTDARFCHKRLSPAANVIGTVLTGQRHVQRRNPVFPLWIDTGGRNEMLMNWTLNHD